ncbi:MAG: oligoendopeptidase F [Proteobacteria bacterium]|nr:oligoendopeptidase F [Pseudomonadota bacterium]
MTKKTLPRWNLERHFGFSSPYDPALDTAVDKLVADIAAFGSTYTGKLNTNLLAALTTLEELVTRQSRVMNYLSLSKSTDETDEKLSKRYGALAQKVGQASAAHMTFFDLELANLSDADVDAQIAANADLAKYRSLIADARVEKPFQLAPEVEAELAARGSFSAVGTAVKFYDRKSAGLTFTFLGKTLNLESLLEYLSHDDEEVRRAAMIILNDGLKGHADVAALSLNAIAGNWFINNKRRGYKGLRDARNRSNKAPDAVVDALLNAIRTDGVVMSKRFYQLKKSILKKTSGLETFDWSSRNAKITSGGKSDKVSWEEAVQIVHDGYAKFSKTMAGLFMQMVNEERIDVPSVPGKRGGAFCAGVTPEIGPFQLLNFNGTKRDVMTLAHESGHGCHDYFAYKQGTLQYHPGLTLAETASIFGEMIVFRDLLDKTASKEERLALLMSKIDDIINSVVRQASFDRFEELFHTARQDGEVSADEASGFWKQTVAEYYGEAGDVFDNYENIENLWAYVGHFHHVPFYVYAYAFADLLVGSLYLEYAKQPQGFEQKLIDLLSSGGTVGLSEVLAPFGLDASAPTFWNDALKRHLGALIAEAEQLAADIGLA